MNILPYLKRHSTIAIVLAAAAVILGGIAARAVQNAKSVPSASSTLPVVQLINAQDYQQGGRQVTGSGTVESLQQADLRAQATGQVAHVNVAVGQQVSEGQTLASLVNNDVAAQVSQAQAMLQAAQANLSALQNGAKPADVQLSQAQLATAQQALTDTKNQQETAVANAYTSFLNASLAAVASPNNATTAQVTITGTYTDTAKGQYVISTQGSGNGSSFSYSGLEFSPSQQINRGVPIKLGTHGLYITFGASGSIGPNDTWTVSIPNTQAQTYLQNLNTYNASVAASQAAVNAAQNAVNTAQQALTLKQAPPTGDQTAGQQALVNQAQANVAAAEAQFAKTIVRAPFAGTISAVPVKVGDLVTNGQAVASIVNKDGLQVKVYVSGTDLPSVQVGSSAKIGDAGIAGTVANVAPSVDPTSKTAEVDIAIADPANSGLTIGQNASVSIAPATGTGTAATGTFALPIEAVKLTPDGKAYVYSVDPNAKIPTLVEHSVTIGPVSGDTVQVTSGITSDEKIVSAASNAANGEQVTVQQ